MWIGIEIGGTKLQLAAGRADGTLAATWRGEIIPTAGAAGIQQQIVDAVPVLLQRGGIPHKEVRGVGIGFGGPVDQAAGRIIKSHQIAGWNDFPLAAWAHERLGLPAVIGNDADLAGLAEATLGAGRNSRTVFYITIGSGIGGGLILNGAVFPGAGKGAAEIGHLLIPLPAAGGCDSRTLEAWAAGWAIQRRAQEAIARAPAEGARLIALAGSIPAITTHHVAQAATAGDPLALRIFDEATDALAAALCHVIALLCPEVIVIGGGVSLIGEPLLFAPLRRKIDAQVFVPFRGLTRIVTAALGEQVVLHGAIALAAQRLSEQS